MSKSPPTIETCKRDGSMYLTDRAIGDCTETTIAGGIVKKMPRDVYDRIRRLNPSSLAEGLVDHLEVNPTAVKYAFEQRRKERTAAAQDRLDRGTLAHILLLQPERIADDVAIWDGGDRKGNAWNNFQAEAGGRLIIKSDDFKAVALACNEFRKQPLIANLLTNYDAEVAMFSSEHNGKIHCKGMVDAVTKGELCNIIDIKTTEAGISYKQVERTIRDFHYREKMALYARWYQRESGRVVNACYDVFLSMVPPYAVRVVKMSEQAMLWGESRMMAVIESIAESLDGDSWPMFVKDDVAIVADWEKGDEDDIQPVEERE